MLKVWRGPKNIFAECTSCGSYGTAGHLQPKVKMDPDIEAAVEKHSSHMQALRGHYTQAAGNIANQIRDGSLARKDGAAKIKELWFNHVAQVRLGEASLPDPTGKVKEVVTACPWCEVVSSEIEVETLPDGVDEPPFSLAVKVVPVALAKGK